MKKIWRTAVLVVLMFVLTGCVFRSPDELYQLPKRSEGYEMLTAEIDRVRRNLEMEFGTVESAVIYSGENTSTIQFQDLDGNGTTETAVTFLRVPGAELPLRIYFFTKQPDGSYEVSCVVEGPGAAIYAVDYEELSGEGKKELIVSWQTSTNMYQLGVYSLKNTENDTLLSPDGMSQTETLPEATELMTTTYSGYSLLDIDQDNCVELAVIRIDSAGINSLVELYGWRDGAFSSLGASRLSNGIAALTKVRSNFVAGSIRAIYITGVLVDASQSTDIVAWRDGRLVNLSLNKESGVSNETIRDYIVSPTDVNDDTVLEMPQPRTIPVYGGGVSRDHYLISWSQYDIEGKKSPVFTTYHNQLDNWYFEVPDYWVDKITIERDDSVTGERAVVFYRWNGPEQDPSPFLVIYKLTGINRTLRATQGDRFILSEDDSTIYAASLIPCKWDHGLDQTDVLSRFHRTITSWATE